MKCLYSYLLLLVFLGHIRVYAQEYDAGVVESKATNDIERIVSRLLRNEQFAVQVTARSESRRDRVLVEGESFSQTVGDKEKVNVPPLPGFSLAPSESADSKPSTQTRQIFKEVEKSILKSLIITVQVDSAVGDEAYRQVEKLVTDYAITAFGSKARLSIVKTKLERDWSFSEAWRNLRNYIFGAIGVFLALWLTWLLWQKAKGTRANDYSQKERWAQPACDENERDISQITQGLSKPEVPLLGSSGPLKHEVDLKNDKYLPVPETAKFAELRSRIISRFLEKSETFRHYWKKLSVDARLELFSALRGPALENLLEVLELERPEAGEIFALPSESQIEFYEENFSEFSQTFEWQNKQFFGFLNHLSHQQLLTLLKNENPLVGALLLKQCKPEISANLLSDLSATQRSEIVLNFARCSDLTAEDLRTIEEKTRKNAEELPHFTLTKQMSEIDYWERVLSQGSNNDAILIELERSNPKLYQKLSRFRFNLQDLPALPNNLIAEVFDKVDNEELALALTELNVDIKTYALNVLNEKRRQLVESQMISLTGVPRTQKEQAQRIVTIKFREAMI